MKKSLKIYGLLLMCCILFGLTACKGEDKEASSNSGVYVFEALDEEKKPVAGVAVSLFDSEGNELTWIPEYTGSTGKIEFTEYEVGDGYVQVVTVPTGYKLDKETKHKFDKEGKVVLNLESDNGASLTSYEAMIGERKFATFLEALEKANESREDVTITLTSDITISEVLINNKFYKNVTIDGAGHVITTQGGDNALKVDQAESTVEFKNMIINHKNTFAVLRTGAGNTVNMTNVDINAVEGAEYYYGLFNLTASRVTTNLNLTDVNVKMAVNTKGKDDYPGIIRTGNNGIDVTKTVNITLTDCNFDATGAPGRAGILMMNTTSGTITMKNSHIKTKDGYAIRANYQPIKMEGSTISSVTYANEPIENRGIVESDNPSQAYTPAIAAKIEDKEYFALGVALSDANASSRDVVITVESDITIKEETINNSAGNNITIDGQGHTITSEKGKNAFEVSQATGVVELKNMTIVHKNSNSVARHWGKCTFNLTDVKIDATKGEVCDYALINISGPGNTSVTNLTRVNIQMAYTTKGIDNPAVIRTGNGNKDDTKTVVLTLTDCNIDASRATGRVGIRIMPTTTAYVTLNNTTIKTMDYYPIRANKQTFILNNSKVSCVKDIFNQYPIEEDDNVIKK